MNVFGLWLVASLLSVHECLGDLRVTWPEQLKGKGFEMLTSYYGGYGIQKEGLFRTMSLRIIPLAEQETLCRKWVDGTWADLVSTYENTLILQLHSLPCTTVANSTIELEILHRLRIWSIWVDAPNIVPGFAVYHKGYGDMAELYPESRHETGYFHVSRSESSLELIEYLTNGGIAHVNLTLDANEWKQLFHSSGYLVFFTVIIPLFCYFSALLAFLFLGKRWMTMRARASRKYKRDRGESRVSVPVLVLSIEIPVFLTLGVYSQVDGFGATGNWPAYITRAFFHFFQGTSLGTYVLVGYLMAKVMNTITPLPKSSWLSKILKSRRKLSIFALFCLFFDLISTVLFAVVLQRAHIMALLYAMVSITFQVVFSVRFGNSFFLIVRELRSFLRADFEGLPSTEMKGIQNVFYGVGFRAIVFFKFGILIQVLQTVATACCGTWLVWHPTGFAVLFGTLISCRLGKSLANVLFCSPLGTREQSKVSPKRKAHENTIIKSSAVLESSAASSRYSSTFNAAILK